jgi:hypothetical protein
VNRCKDGLFYVIPAQWEQFMELGKDIEDSVIEKKIEAEKPEQCALLIYTVSDLELGELVACLEF